MSSLILKSDPTFVRLTRENLTIDDIKEYVINNKIFDESEIPWMDFFWKSQIEMVKILLTKEILKDHFGYSGKRPIHNYVENVLKKSKRNYKEGVDFIKVGRDHVLVREYLSVNPQDKTRIFYLLSASCYTLCLLDANTVQSKAAGTYLIKMNFIAIRLMSVILITRIEDLEIINININQKLDVVENIIDDIGKSI